MFMKRKENAMKKLMTIAAVALLLATGARAASEHAYGERDHHSWFLFGMSFISAPIQIPTTAYSVYGVMLDVGYGQVTDSYFLNAGIVNHVTHNMGGLQAGFVNIDHCMFGVQGGIVNYAGDAYGLQLGFVNIAGHLHGLQLGLVNVNLTGMPVFPIFNIGF